MAATPAREQAEFWPEVIDTLDETLRGYADFLPDQREWQFAWD